VRLLNRSAGRLSRLRRGRLAGLVVLLIGLLLTGGLYASFAPAQAGKADSNEELVKEGRELFLVSCSFCHGQNGEGILTKDGDNFGPPLTDVGAAAVDFQVGTGRMPAQVPGAQIPPKTPVFDEEETAALAAYVDSLGTGPAIPEETDYDLDAYLEGQGLEGEELAQAREESISRGGQIFLSNCTACHNFEGAGGAMPRGGQAPKIRGVDSKYIYEAMLTGPQSMDTFSNGNLPPDAKRDVIAYLNELDDQPEQGGWGSGGLGPVVEGMWAWLIGIGLCVGFAVWIASHSTRSTKEPSKGVDA